MNDGMFTFFFIAVFVIAIITFISIMLKNRKNLVKRENLVENNQFVKNNKDMFEKLISDNAEIRKRYLTRIIITITVAAVINLILLIVNSRLYVLIALVFIICFIFVGIDSSKYSKVFKEEVVANIIKSFDNDLEYYPLRGFSSSEYNYCRFPEECDRYHSEDLIVNNKTGFCYADILIESEHEDSDGKTYTTVEYEGSLAKIDIKYVNCNIYLGGMKRFLFGDNNCVKVNFEDDEFNKLFKAYTTNELASYKILTPDVMEQFVHLKKNTYGDIDIRILNDKLYIRFDSGNGFVPSLISEKREKESIIASIAVLEEVINVMNNVKKLLESKNDN